MGNFYTRRRLLILAIIVLCTLYYIISSIKNIKDLSSEESLSGLAIFNSLKEDNKRDQYTGCANHNHSSLPLWQQDLDFNILNISNETGRPDSCYLVPNYVHFIWLGDKPINYVQLICILAAFKRQRPEKVFLHYDNKTTFSGKYWKVLEEAPGFIETVVFNEIVLPNEIFGQPLNKEFKTWHASDIQRIRIMMKYGGVYLDNDSYMIKNIDEFRRFETTIDWEDKEWMGTQVIIAHKDSRFLKKWLDGYRQYEGTKWYYNAGEKPTMDILQKEPHLVHRVQGLFGVNTKYRTKFYQERWHGWRDFYVMHLLARQQHQWALRPLGRNARFPVEFTEDNIGYYPITFRDMAYDVYDVANVTWPTNMFN